EPVDVGELPSQSQNQAVRAEMLRTALVSLAVLIGQPAGQSQKETRRQRRDQTFVFARASIQLDPHAAPLISRNQLDRPRRAARLDAAAQVLDSIRQPLVQQLEAAP